MTLQATVVSPYQRLEAARNKTVVHFVARHYKLMAGINLAVATCVGLCLLHFLPHFSIPMVPSFTAKCLLWTMAAAPLNLLGLAAIFIAQRVDEKRKIENQREARSIFDQTMSRSTAISPQDQDSDSDSGYVTAKDS